MKINNTRDNNETRKETRTETRKEKRTAHPRYKMDDDALPVGGKDDALHREKLLYRLERRQQRLSRLVEHQQAVEGHAVAGVVHD